MIPQIYNIELIGSGSLSIMAKPVSGEWIEDEFSGIANYGINKVISLLESHEAYEVGLDKERTLVEKNGMTFFSYPLRDRGVPKSIEDYLVFTQWIYHEAARCENIVIHCRAGIGRTGMIAAGVLLHCGFDPKDAIEYISEKRSITVPDTDEQVEWVVKSFAELLKNFEKYRELAYEYNKTY